MKMNTHSLAEVVQPRRKKVSPSDYPDLPYVGLEHIEAHTMRLLGTVPAKEMKSSANRFECGDVLYSRLRPYLNKVWRADREGLCSAEFIVIPGNEKIDPDFLRYRLNANDFVSFASGLNAGDRPRVDFDQISVFKTQLPEALSVQREIVSEIEKQFTRLDAGVSALRRVQANLKRYRAAVLKAACEGKLVPTEAELAKKERRKYETGSELLQRILVKRRQKWHGRGKYKEPSSSDVANFSSLPEGWTYATVEQLSIMVQYGSSAKTNEDPTGVPVLRMGNIQQGKFDFDSLKYLPKKHDEFPDLLLKNGDLVFNRTNSAELVGKTAVFKGNPNPCSFASYLIRARLAEECPPDYVCYFINSIYGRAWIKSVVNQQVGQANVNGTKLQALAVPLPPLIEQKRIVEEVDRRLSVIDEMEMMVTANLQRATRFRQAILKMAFDAKLVPSLH